MKNLFLHKLELKDQTHDDSAQKNGSRLLWILFTPYHNLLHVYTAGKFFLSAAGPRSGR
jgi:hypothetical protein